MEHNKMEKVLKEIRERLDKLNTKMQGEVMEECNKHKKIYKELIKLAGDLNAFFAE